MKDHLIAKGAYDRRIGGAINNYGIRIHNFVKGSILGDTKMLGRFANSPRKQENDSEQALQRQEGPTGFKDQRYGEESNYPD